ncbi:AMP-binding enzyme [Kitasatospora terrestris]|uniref:AMP-binding enzyme n=1 Tax=Kitasatospora terrestris TaxID=258051 RepID=UPI0031EFAAA1
MAEQQLSEEHGGDEPAPPAGTIGARPDRTAPALPDREPLVDVETGRRRPWSAPAADVDRPARGLRAPGVRPGDRVAVRAANCPVEVMKPVRTELRVPEAAIAYGMTGTAPVSTVTRRDDDLAVMRSDGCPAVVGRIKDVIIRRGANVHPREVEEFLPTHPATADGPVVGVPDERPGEEVRAFAVLRDPAAAPAAAPGVAESAAFCRGRPAHCETPRHLRVVPGFPPTAGGKVRGAELRDPAARALAR